MTDLEIYRAQRAELASTMNIENIGKPEQRKKNLLHGLLSTAIYFDGVEALRPWFARRLAEAIRQAIGSDTVTAIAKRFDVSRRTVERIRAGKTYLPPGQSKTSLQRRAMREGR